MEGVLPIRTIGFATLRSETIFSIIVRSSSEGPDVITIFSSWLARRSSISAVRSSVQHLKKNRAAGWTST
ncbi:unknown [Sutterella sp. CAG:351]|nr:unknown [Sutterella sp. CAG:351]